MKRTNKAPLVGIVMGSDSDWPIMQAAVDLCTQFKIAHEYKVISAHRTPTDMIKYAQQAQRRGLKVIIAGAGGAAHLPGMLASATPLPVIGVPIGNTKLKGIDALLSIIQMPPGVPVATTAIDGSHNAALLTIQILACHDRQLQTKIKRYKTELANRSRKKNDTLPPPGVEH